MCSLRRAAIIALEFCIADFTELHVSLTLPSEAANLAVAMDTKVLVGELCSGKIEIGVVDTNGIFRIELVGSKSYIAIKVVIIINA